MKIHELLGTTELLEAASSSQLDAFNKARQSEDYKKLLKVMNMTSTERQLKNGSLEFSVKGNLKNNKLFHISIGSNAVRAKFEYDDRWYKLKEFKEVTDPNEFYKLAFEYLLDSYNKWNTKHFDEKKYYNKKENRYEIENKGLTSFNEIKQLIPESVENLFVRENHLSNFNGCPNVTNKLGISNNNLTTLEGCPKDVQMVSVFNNNLTSLKGCPETLKALYISNNNLTSLEYAPKKLESFLNARNNKITHLKGIGKDYLCEINGEIDLKGNPIKSHILGLLKIKGLHQVLLDDKNIQKIINKYIPLGNVVECAEELIENGYKEMAQL